MPVDYKNGKIYKLTCENLTYYGSTTQALCVRLAGHNANYKVWKNGKRNNTSSSELFDIGNPIITLVEDFSCDRKEQLLARERWYIENNECVNKQIPIRTREELCELQKQQSKKYYEQNAVRIKEQQKEYNEQNKDKRKEYVAQNADKIKEKKKQYREENADKIQEYREQNAERIKEYREINKDYIAEYKKDHYVKNKEAIQSKQKEYNKDNKTKIKEQRKSFYEQNKEVIQQRNDDYRQKNIDNILQKNRDKYEANKEAIRAQQREKWTCECCQKAVALSSKSRHLKTAKHIAKSVRV